MRIERFQIQGFKSIADLTVTGLSEINVFFGLNNVGKSNIFQALELWHWLLLHSSTVKRTGVNPTKYEIPLHQLEQHFGSLLVRLGYKNRMHFTVELSSLQAHSANQQPSKRLSTNVTLRIASDVAHCEIELHEGATTDTLDPSVNLLERWLPHLPPFHVVHAGRRLQTEFREKKELPDVISDHNFKQALFYAYLSSDLEQKKRLNAIKRILAEPPFALGELDIALDPATDRIDIGFVRPDGRLPIENLGSGTQQLMLVLGQIFLNDYPIIAVEEPEMNLAPQYQEYLLAALRKLMQEPAVKLQQLFIATHSPYFEFTENFYDVTFDPMAGTCVSHATSERYTQHFAITPAGQATGARVNSLNQVQLYPGLIQDLGLQRGDLVIFARNPAGRWEIRPAQEIAQELQTITNNNGTA